METAPKGLEQVADLARRLSPLDKLRLIKGLTHDVEAYLAQKTVSRRRSLRGVLKGCSIGPDDVDQARQEMWRKFPREDI